MIEPRLRAILLGIAAAGFAGMIAELLLVEHWGLPWQITPFTLSAVAIVSIGLFALRPSSGRSTPGRRPVQCYGVPCAAWLRPWRPAVLPWPRWSRSWRPGDRRRVAASP